MFWSVQPLYIINYYTLLLLLPANQSTSYIILMILSSHVVIRVGQSDQSFFVTQ